MKFKKGDKVRIRHNGYLPGWGSKPSGVVLRVGMDVYQPDEKIVRVLLDGSGKSWWFHPMDVILEDEEDLPV